MCGSMGGSMGVWVDRLAGAWLADWIDGAWAGECRNVQQYDHAPVNTTHTVQHTIMQPRRKKECGRLAATPPLCTSHARLVPTPPWWKCF